jgi:hypothetical protein
MSDYTNPQTGFTCGLYCSLCRARLPVRLRVAHVNSKRHLAAHQVRVSTLLAILLHRPSLHRLNWPDVNAAMLSWHRDTQTAPIVLIITIVHYVRHRVGIGEVVHMYCVGENVTTVCRPCSSVDAMLHASLWTSIWRARVTFRRLVPVGYFFEHMYI